MKFFLFVLFLLVASVGSIPTVFANEVPDWVKNTAGWWATDAISEKEFVNAIEFLVKDGIISIEKNDTQINYEDFFTYGLYKIPNSDSAKINSHGFRGDEITKDKPDNTFRIMTVGGSTTFSVGVTEKYTWPALLQTKVNDLNSNLDIQIINAGINSGTSVLNSNLIKQKLINFSPDLFIIYEGVNDQGCMMDIFVNRNTVFDEEAVVTKCGVYALQDYPKFLAERYSGICELGSKNNFETIIVFQPTVKLDGKILTNQELDSYFERPQYPIYLENYGKMIQDTLSNIKNCHTTADFTKIFDNYDYPTYFDYHHVGNVGNTRIAEEMLNLVIPILIDNNIVESDIVNMNTDGMEPISILDPIDVTNSNFSNQVIKDTSFFGNDLSGSDFSNTKLTNIDFRLANLENINFSGSNFDQVKLRQNAMSGANFENVDFSNTDLNNVDFSNVNLQGANLSDKDLRKTFFHNTDLRNSDLSSTVIDVSFLKNVDLRGANLSQAILNDVEFGLIKNKSLENAIIFETNISFANLNEIIFPKQVINSNFQWSELQNADMSNSSINHSYFGDSIMKGINLENSNMNAIMYEYEFPSTPELSSLPNTKLVKELTNLPVIVIFEKEISDGLIKLITINFNNFEYADLSNAKMKNSQFQYADFTGVNLTNADLSGSDLTGANLSGSDLTGANLSGSDLTGATLLGAKMDCFGHELCG